MKVGTEDRKKVGILTGLVVIGGYLLYTNVIASPDSGAPREPAAAVTRPNPVSTPAPEPPRRLVRSGSQSDEFHPVLHSKRPEDRIDPSKVDPTLRLDLLAKLQTEPSGNGRNLFQFGPPPPPPAALKGPEPKIIPKPVSLTKVGAAPVNLAAPPPPPIPLKYYGFTSAPGSKTKTAFFLDGDDILVAKEGDTLKRKYRVIRIGPTSVVMEDTDSKHEQTLRMDEIPG